LSTTIDAPDFEQLLSYVKASRGFDFTGYKRSTLQRRVQKRMASVGVQSYTDYIDFLEVHPDEFPQLFNTILINVTSFFRDPEAWEVLTRDVVPRLLAEKGPTGQIRMWSAGCASGEEAYTLAMIVAEAVGIEAFRDRVKIYATDADEDALNLARAATYPENALEGISAELRSKYFEMRGANAIFRADLRRSIIFGRHDLVQDAPMSRLDLLICRNVMIYFNAETQARILARFHFALCDNGAIFLGKSEMLLSHAKLFAPIDMRSRIFARLPRTTPRERVAETSMPKVEQHSPARDRLRQVALDSATIAQVVLDREGVLVYANAQARSLFQITAGEFGKLFQDLELSYRPLEIRSHIAEAYAQNRPVHIPDVEFANGRGDARYMDVQVSPLMDSSRVTLGMGLSFVDVTQQHRLKLEVERTTHELETAYEELQATNEELETTNEELQSTVEELETTNEEMQSTNQELETLNEELHSTNEELETMNEELRRSSDDLMHANLFTESVLTSLRAAVIVVDPNLNVRSWNHSAEDMWGLRSDEVAGKSLLALDIGFPVDRVKSELNACLDGSNDHVRVRVSATNRRGRAIECNVVCTRMASPDARTLGAIVFIEEESRTSDGGNGDRSAATKSQKAGQQ
jgi:two-component system, chemotaxis family, CheB/CheR fusion protein